MSLSPPSSPSSPPVHSLLLLPALVVLSHGLAPLGAVHSPLSAPSSPVQAAGNPVFFQPPALPHGQSHCLSSFHRCHSHQTASLPHHTQPSSAAVLPPLHRGSQTAAHCRPPVSFVPTMSVSLVDELAHHPFPPRQSAHNLLPPPLLFVGPPPSTPHWQ